MLHELAPGDIVPRFVGPHDLTKGLWDEFDFVDRTWRPAAHLLGRAFPTWFVLDYTPDLPSAYDDALVNEPGTIVLTYRGANHWVAALRPRLIASEP